MSNSFKTYVKECGAVSDINSLVGRLITGGSMILLYTDRFICCEQRDIEDTEHLLEARIFNLQSELKIMRPTIADAFSFRYIEDSGLVEKKDYFPQEHYLDINPGLSYGTSYISTGGGKYQLPVENAERIQIRNYVSYDEQNIAQITDFRCVRYLEKGDE
ncbi:type III-D CRISPR-associated protein Csx19 [Ruminococcus flavefaciens]|uniref:type III-D CRISPR-associated protein Csx19 n=1 Tax=Ruminococcus flavefaciens TaxID=1265 RepID=UPI0012BCCEB0|nr:CRISPR-associated protein Csx19 [Ruminococcus flavefaciens]